MSGGSSIVVFVSVSGVFSGAVDAAHPAINNVTPIVNSHRFIFRSPFAPKDASPLF
jgi:hypothetical protein